MVSGWLAVLMDDVWFIGCGEKTPYWPVNDGLHGR